MNEEILQVIQNQLSHYEQDFLEEIEGLKKENETLKDLISSLINSVESHLLKELQPVSSESPSESEEEKELPKGWLTVGQYSYDLTLYTKIFKIGQTLELTGEGADTLWLKDQEGLIRRIQSGEGIIAHPSNRIMPLIRIEDYQEKPREYGYCRIADPASAELFDKRIEDFEERYQIQIIKSLNSTHRSKWIRELRITGEMLTQINNG